MMRTNIRACFFILFAMVSLSSCNNTSYYIDESIKKLSIDIPSVPEKWIGGNKNSSSIFLYAESTWENKPDTLLSKTIQKEYYALSTHWLNPIDSVFSSDMDFATACSKARPISDIVFPDKILAYNNLYPHDDNYKLVRKTIIHAKTKDNASDEAAKYLASIQAASVSPMIWLGAVGDIMPGKTSAEILLQAAGPNIIFGKLLPIMIAQDVLIGNLETAITERGEEWPKTFRFRSKASVIKPLLASGIDVVTLANNHVYDYTEIGFSDTLKALNDNGLPFVGAGNTWDEAIKPYIKQMADLSIYVWGLGAFPIERTGFYGLKHASIQRGKPGLLWADEKAVNEVCTSIKNAKNNNAFCVVTVHAGLEYTERPYETQTKLYRRLINAGADIVLGHHPHVLQPMELYQGENHSGLIVYSLGNYIFDGMEDNIKGLDTMLLSIGIYQGQIRALKIYPAKMDGFGVDLADASIKLHLVNMSKAWAQQKK